MEQYSYLEATFNNKVYGLETQSHAAKVLLDELIDNYLHIVQRPSRE